MDADVWSPGARGHVPVDLPYVVLDRLVGADLRELAALAEQRRAMVAGQEALHAARDRQIERAQQGLGHRPGTGASGSQAPAENPLDHAACPARSSCGTGTA